MSFDALARAMPAIARLRAYDTGSDKQGARERTRPPAELGSNENPYGPSPRAVEAMTAVLANAHRYPDPDGTALKRTLERRFGVAPAGVTLGNGSNELLVLLAQCFAGPGRSVVFSQYAFAVYAIATAAVGAEAVVVPALPRDHAAMPLGHDLDALAAAVREDTSLVFLANPNNPTGTWFDDAALAAFLARVPREVIVVLDEAYLEFATAPGLGPATALLARHPNLVVARTFSKAYGLAALRLGYAVSDPSVAGVLARLRQPFNGNALALAAATAALEDTAYLDDTVARVVADRDGLADALRARGFGVLPSQGNFLMLDAGERAAAIAQAWYDAGIIVRPMGAYGLPQMLRISIGTRAENERLLEALA